MSKQTLRIATRESQLALWQARHISDALKALHPKLNIEIVGMTTKGDRILDKSLSKIGGKGLFTKELESALLENKADLAVHCVKDMPYAMPEGLSMPVICERASPWDAFISNTFSDIDALPQGSIIGTSSLRRQAQLLSLRPDLNIEPLRGNLTTRLKHLDDGRFDAIILAAAGLERLGWAERIRSTLPVNDMLPAVGQGALGLEIRHDDSMTYELIAPLNHQPTALCISAERSMNKALSGSCQVPIGGFSTIDLTNKRLELTGLVATACGGQILRQSHGVTCDFSVRQAEELGKTIATGLMAQGATQILDALRLPSHA